MAVEAKMGMAIVVILVGAFGFLVYHKFDLRQRELLQAQLKANGQGPEAIAVANAVAQHSESLEEFNPTAGNDTADLFAKMAQEATPPLSSADTFAATERNAVEPTAFSVRSQPEPSFELNEPTADIASTFPPPASPPSSKPTLEKTVTEDPFAGLMDGQPAQPDRTTAPEAVADTVSDSLADLIAVAKDQPPAFERTESKPQPFPSFDEPGATPPAVSSPSETVVEFAPTTKPATSPEETPSPDFASSTSKTTPGNDGSAAMKDEFTPDFSPRSEALADNVNTELVPLLTDNTDPFSGFRPGNSESLDAPSSDSVQGDDSTELSPSTMVAMLEPAADVNLFEDAAPIQKTPAAAKPSVKSSEIDRELQPKKKPSAPRVAQEFPQFQRNSGLRNDDTVPDPRPIQRSFNEPTQADTTGPSESPFGGGLLLPIDDGSIAGPSDSDSESFVTLPIPMPMPNQSVEEQVGVAQFVPGARVQQVAGTVQSDEISEVRPNDTYWTISKRVYGTVRYFSSLALYNQHRIPDPRKLRPGMKVLVPRPEVLEEKYPELFKDYQRKPTLPSGYFLQADGRPAYRVGDRETLSEISQKHLGRASRWIQIYQMNRNILKDPNKLKPGTVIALPDDATDLHMAP